MADNAAARLGELAGAWRRTLFASGDLRDESTEVWWFQAATLFVDLRLPPGGARAEGFAGRLAQDGDIFEWRRDIDLDEAGASPDAGTLRFDGEELVETGVHEPYLERWERDPVRGGGVWAAELSGEAGERAVVVRAGSRFAWASSEPIGPGRAQIAVGACADGGWSVLRAADPADVGARLVLAARPERMRSRFRRTDGTVAARCWRTVYEEGARAR